MTNEDEGFLYKDLTYKIIGIAMEIHRELHSGFFGSGYEPQITKIKSLTAAGRRVIYILSSICEICGLT